VAREEVGWPADVLVTEVAVDRDEAGAGTRGQRDRANNAGVVADTPDKRAAVTRDHHELRIDARTMPTRPAAIGRPTNSHTDDLARRRV